MLGTCVVPPDRYDSIEMDCRTAVSRRWRGLGGGWLAALISVWVLGGVGAVEASVSEPASGPIAVAVDWQGAVADLLACQLPSGGFGYVCKDDTRVIGVTAVMRHAERIAGLLGRADWDLVVLRSPGTPAAGLVLLAAARHGASPAARAAGLRAADLLVTTQLPTGGWFSEMPASPVDGHLTAWFPWVSPGDTLDDDVTSGAIRLLLEAWRETGELRYRAAAERAVALLLAAQLPTGAWPLTARSSWRRELLPSFEDLGSTNDAATTAPLTTLLAASRLLDRPDLLAAARRAGDWLVAVQGDGSQSAWAQQFDHTGRPAPGRRFEPAAWATWETRQVVEALDALARATGDDRYCTAASRATDWLALAALGPGCWPRLRGLEDGQPLFVDDRGRPTSRLADARRPYRWVGDFGIPAVLARFGTGAPGLERELGPTGDGPRGRDGGVLPPRRIPGDPGSCPGESPLETRVGSENPRVRIVRAAVLVAALDPEPEPWCRSNRLAADR